MTNEEKAKKAAIVRLLMSFPSSQGLGVEVVNAYVEAVEDVSVEAVALACERFSKGLVPGRNNAFPPSGAELAVQARLFHRERSNLVLLHNGLIEMDWGGGKVRLAGLTTEEQDVVIAAKGRTEDGRTMAGMSIEDLRQAIYRPAIPLRGVRR